MNESNVTKTSLPLKLEDFADKVLRGRERG